MKQLFLGKGTLLGIAVLLIVFIGIKYIITPDKSDEYPNFVSDSPAPTGVKAFYTYLKNEKKDVGRWSHAPALLSEKSDGQLLIMVEPSFTPDKSTMNNYTSFMETGNTILLLKANPDGMFDLRTEPTITEPGEGELQDKNEATYQAEKLSPFRIRTNDDDNVLFHDDAGVLAMKRSYHDGTLITAVAPNWITNDKILDGDHLELLLSLIHEENQEWKTIYIDEYIHEPKNAASITTLYPDWLLIIAFQIILLAIIWLWYQGKRFGTIVVPREETARFSDERIRALAAWYQRGHLYYDSIQIQADYLKLLLQERWGIPYRKDWTDITEPLERKQTTVSDEDVPSFLSGLTHILRKGSISKQEYLLWSKNLDELRKEVEEK